VIAKTTHCRLCRHTCRKSAVSTSTASTLKGLATSSTLLLHLSKKKIIFQHDDELEAKPMYLSMLYRTAMSR
jgi:hypothetical protein